MASKIWHYNDFSLLIIMFRFTDQDLKDLFRVLDAAAAVDGSAAVVLSDGYHPYHHQQQHQQQNYYGGGYSQQQLTLLQDEILQCLGTLERETLFVGTVSEATMTADNVGSVCAGDSGKKNSIEQRRLVQRFLCPLFDQLLKFCRFVCPPLPSFDVGDRQQLINGVPTVDHFHHHNKVCIF